MVIGGEMGWGKAAIGGGEEGGGWEEDRAKRGYERKED